MIVMLFFMMCRDQIDTYLKFYHLMTAVLGPGLHLVHEVSVFTNINLSLLLPMAALFLTESPGLWLFQTTISAYNNYFLYSEDFVFLLKVHDLEFISRQLFWTLTLAVVFGGVITFNFA